LGDFVTFGLSEFQSGRLVKGYEYSFFVPSSVNKDWLWQDTRINSLLEEATRLIGELNAFSRYVPDVDLYIQMHVRKEANTSSRIEGTRTEMDEVVRSKDDIAPERRDDWVEVQNYIAAMNSSVTALDKLPLSNRLLKDAHQTLLTGVRGEQKLPGEFRTSQNWIGGASIKDAFYIPPSPDEVPELMSDLEKFWHNDQIEVPHLIRAALSHYQFETVHPFLDGNGRIGRLLITLYLIHAKVLARPCLYLSDYLERHKGQYFDSLTLVRQKSDLAQWIKFFLAAVIETANSGIETFQSILKVRDEVNHSLVSMNKTRAQNVQKLIQYLYSVPVVDVETVIRVVKVSKPAAYALVTELEKKGILKELTGRQRGKSYSFQRYLDLF
jgi:Fic family protein